MKLPNFITSRNSVYFSLETIVNIRGEVRNKWLENLSLT